MPFLCTVQSARAGPLWATLAIFIVIFHSDNQPEANGGLWSLCIYFLFIRSSAWFEDGLAGSEQSSLSIRVTWRDQTSYLSQISQIIFVEKNLSWCGDISDFCKELEQFMIFYQNLCHFCSKSVWRKNDKYEVWKRQTVCSAFVLSSAIKN